LDIAQYKNFFDTYREWQKKAQQNAIISVKFENILSYISKNLKEFETVEKKCRYAMAYFQELEQCLKIDGIKDEYICVRCSTPDLEEMLEYMTKIWITYGSVNRTFVSFVNRYKIIYERSGPVIANLHNQYIF